MDVRWSMLIVAAGLLLVAMAGVPIGASASAIAPIENGHSVATTEQSSITVRAFPRQEALDTSSFNGDPERVKWALAVLHGIGNVDPVPEITGVVVEWTLSEDGSDGAIRRHNAMNTTLCLPGRMTGAINGDGACGVQGYATFEDGVAATVATINQANMRSIKEGLLGTDPDAARRGIWESPWAASRYGGGSAWAYLK